MADEDLQAKGRAVTGELLGEETTDKLDRELFTDDPIMEKFAELFHEVIFGVLWSRPGLDLEDPFAGDRGLGCRHRAGCSTAAAPSLRPPDRLDRG